MTTTPLLRRGLRLLVTGALALLAGVAPGLAAAEAATPAPAAQSASATQSAPAAHAAAVGRTVPLSSLPPEATDTVNLIQQGGPFPYSHDGIVFTNREGVLPSERSGYYHEYTVVTPGSPDRGARRIITGADGEYYYTSDHYASFVGVDVSR